MRGLLLITGLLVALSWLIRSADAQTPIVGYGSNGANEIRLIDLGTGQIVPSPFDSFTYTVPFSGLAIDPAGENLYGSDQNGNLYRIEISTGAETPLGNMGIIVPDKTEIEAMDFNGDELWVTDFDSNTPTIYKINNFDTTDPIAVPISATPVQTVSPEICGGVVLTMVADTMSVDPTIDVWVANDNFPSMDFQSIDIDVSVNNITHIGFLDDDPVLDEFAPRPKIKGMDRADDGMLYGLAGGGGVYSIDQASGLLTLIKDTNHEWLGLAVAAPTTPVAPTMKIAFDIKPKHCPNKLYVKKWRKAWKKKRRHGDDDSSSDDGSGHKKKGVLKTAILGTETFNVGSIDIDSIRLNGVAPEKYRYKDLTCPTVLNPCDCEVLDADTFEDLVLYFKKKDIVKTLGDIQNGEEIPLLLTGLLQDGTEIEGTDCVLIVDKRRRQHR